MVQIIKCKCGSVFAGCIEPYCYTDKEWTKPLRQHVLEGCTVEMIKSTDFKFEKCKCVKPETKTEPKLSL